MHFKTDLLISKVKVVGYRGLQQVAISSGKIRAIAPNLEVSDVCASIDLDGDWLSLGGIDLQINGGLGLAFPDLESQDLDKLQQICDFLYEGGVDGFLPTIVTTSLEKIERSLATLAEFIEGQNANTARV